MEIVIGQEAICPDGLGRITEIRSMFGNRTVTHIKVKTYARNRQCEWAASNVQVIPLHNPAPLNTRYTIK